MSGSFNPGVQRALVWTGPAVAFFLALGMIPLTGFLPAPSPKDSGEEIARMYQDDQTRIRVGCAVMMIAGAMWATWAGSIAMWMRRMENGYPSLTYGALCCIGYGVLIFEAFPLFWGVAAFRPSDIDPDTTRMLNDIGWYCFVFTWPPFALLCILLAVAILTDRAEQPAFPRWAAYLNLWAGLSLSPGILIAFFKSGPFAYNGILAVYIPLAIFFAWIVVMTWLMFRAVTAEERRSVSSASTEKAVVSG